MISEFSFQFPLSDASFSSFQTMTLPYDSFAFNYKNNKDEFFYMHAQENPDDKKYYQEWGDTWGDQLVTYPNDPTSSFLEAISLADKGSKCLVGVADPQPTFASYIALLPTNCKTKYST